MSETHGQRPSPPFAASISASALRTARAVANGPVEAPLPVPAFVSPLAHDLSNMRGPPFSRRTPHTHPRQSPSSAEPPVFAIGFSTSRAAGAAVREPLGPSTPLPVQPASDTCSPNLKQRRET